VTKIRVVRGDVTTQPVDAIVTAGNSALRGGSGVNGAVHTAAGPRLLAASRALAPCPAGSAVITLAFDLAPVQWVIHVVGPRFGDPNDAELLRSAYRSARRWRRRAGPPPSCAPHSLDARPTRCPQPARSRPGQVGCGPPPHTFPTAGRAAPSALGTGRLLPWRRRACPFRLTWAQWKFVDRLVRPVALDDQLVARSRGPGRRAGVPPAVICVVEHLNDVSSGHLTDWTGTLDHHVQH